MEVWYHPGRLGACIARQLAGATDVRRAGRPSGPQCACCLGAALRQQRLGPPAALCPSCCVSGSTGCRGLAASARRRCRRRRPPPDSCAPIFFQFLAPCCCTMRRSRSSCGGGGRSGRARPKLPRSRGVTSVAAAPAAVAAAGDSCTAARIADVRHAPPAWSILPCHSAALWAARGCSRGREAPGVTRLAPAASSAADQHPAIAIRSGHAPVQRQGVGDIVRVLAPRSGPHGAALAAGRRPLAAAAAHRRPGSIARSTGAGRGAAGSCSRPAQRRQRAQHGVATAPGPLATSWAWLRRSQHVGRVAASGSSQSRCPSLPGRPLHAVPPSCRWAVVTWPGRSVALPKLTSPGAQLGGCQPAQLWLPCSFFIYNA